MFHDGSTNDYNFIIKELSEELEGQFECLGENTKKYVTFSVPIQKEIDNGKSIKCKISFIVHNLSDRLHSDKCTDCKSYLDYISIKNNQLIFWFFDCKKNYNKDFNKTLMKRFANTYELFDKKINKLILLLTKVFLFLIYG